MIWHAKVLPFQLHNIQLVFFEDYVCNNQYVLKNMAHHHFTLFNDCCFSDKSVPCLKFGVSMCVRACVRACVCVFKLDSSNWRGEKEGSLCGRPHSPSHSECSHSRDVGWSLVQTQIIYCPSTNLQGNLSFFLSRGWGGGLFLSPICLPLIPGEGMCDAERDRLQTDGGRVSV